MCTFVFLLILMTGSQFCDGLEPPAAEVSELPKSTESAETRLPTLTAPPATLPSAPRTRRYKAVQLDDSGLQRPQTARSATSLESAARSGPQRRMGDRANPDSDSADLTVPPAPEGSSLADGPWPTSPQPPIRSFVIPVWSRPVVPPRLITCYNPLYFEDANLERFGGGWPRSVQPFVSGAHFFGSVGILPLKMVGAGPCRTVCPWPDSECPDLSPPRNFLGPTPRFDAVVEHLCPMPAE